MVSFSGTDWTKGKNPNMLVRLHGRLVQPLEQDFFPTALYNQVSLCLSLIFVCFCQFTLKIWVALAWLREITESLNALVDFLGRKRKWRGSNWHLVAWRPEISDCNSYHTSETWNCRAGRNILPILEVSHPDLWVSIWPKFIQDGARLEVKASVSKPRGFSPSIPLHFLTRRTRMCVYV